MAEYVSKMTLAYPPEHVLTEDEEAALASMKLNAAERAGLERLVADACAATLFHFFCLMDNVGHPEVGDIDEWTGARFVALQSSPDYTMLHDEFGEMYWKYKAAREPRDR
jgi:hypothetical protein